MFTDKNIQNMLLDDSDDINFSSQNQNQSSTSKPFFNQPKKDSFIGRNTGTSEVMKPSTYNFMKPTSNNEFQSNNQEFNAKPNYLNKIKTLNSMNATQNSNTVFRPSQTFSTKKEEPYENENTGKQVQENPLSYSNTNKNEYNPMQRPNSSGIGMGMRPQSSQSSANMGVRQQFLEQQKQKLKDKQNALVQSKSITMNANNKPSPFNNPSFFNERNKQSEEIDYDKLQNVVKQDDREQYEPGTNRKTFNLPGLNKADHTISFKPEEQISHQTQEKLNVDNFDDNPTTRKEDVGLLSKPTGNKTLMMKETLKEQTPIFDDVEQQQRSSEIKETSPHNKSKNKSVKFLEKKQEDEDLDDETLKIARQIKALKDGKQQGEIKISLGGNNLSSTFEEVKKEKNSQKKKTLNEEPKESVNKKNSKQSYSDEDNNDGEEEKIQPQSKPIDKNVSTKIFHNFDSITDLKAFILNPAPKNYIIQCVIRRERTGWGRIYPKYKLFFSNRGTYLLSGKKRSANKTSNYMISLSPDDFRKNSENVVGKVRSNFMGTEFHLFDTGCNPKKALSLETVRKELAVITYETNFFGVKGPRKMKALIPDMKEDGESFYEWKPTKNDEGLLQYFKSGKREGYKHLFNKPPKWNENIGAFVLNFNGRVDKPSVKNFQLIDENDDNIVYLQFGRIGNDEFTMDYMCPLTAVQAFGICLSSFDYKIACE